MNKPIIVISGGTTGFGRALALEFGKAQHTVYSLYHTNPEAAAALLQEFSSKGISGHCLRQDVTQEFSLPPEILNTQELTLVHNACPAFSPQAFHLVSWSDFQNQLDVAVKGAFRFYRSGLKTMSAAKKGTFIAVLTLALKEFPKGFSAYLTAKSALQGLVRALASEYRAKGIRFFTISPGYMNTDLTRAWPGALKSAKSMSPEAVAAEVFRIYQNPQTRGEGEDYHVFA